MTTKNTSPLESAEGLTFVAYLRTHGYKFHHVPNETGHSEEAKRRAGRMKQQGTSPGFPDYIILVNRTLMVVELKRRIGGTVSSEQREWLQALAACGVPTFVARGAAEAIEAVEDVAKLSSPALIANAKAANKAYIKTDHEDDSPF